MFYLKSLNWTKRLNIDSATVHDEYFLHLPGLHLASTRKLYEKRLQKLLDQPPAEPEAPAEVTALPKADSNQNGNTNSDQYSDKEDGEL